MRKKVHFLPYSSPQEGLTLPPPLPSGEEGVDFSKGGGEDRGRIVGEGKIEGRRGEVM
jgi:hypothetical protein